MTDVFGYAFMLERSIDRGNVDPTLDAVIAILEAAA